ncbi:hypothetical protein [Microbacterium sp.]|jgi:hypothetical protein|uniref:hypothetical protein n=1 Tax=Microbacterium sp. TaxID=51671 RepID=UPI0037C50A5D
MTDPNTHQNTPESAPQPTAPHQTEPSSWEETPEATADPLEQEEEASDGFGAVRSDLA